METYDVLWALQARKDGFQLGRPRHASLSHAGGAPAASSGLGDSRLDGLARVDAGVVGDGQQE
jgi:hypothetical protein